MIPPPLVGRLLARSRRTSARHCAIKLLFNRENISGRAALSPVCILPFALPSDRRHSQDDGLAERVASHVSSFLRQRNSDTEELRLDAPGPWIFSIDPFYCGPIHTRASYRRYDPPSIDFPATLAFSFEFLRRPLYKFESRFRFYALTQCGEITSDRYVTVAILVVQHLMICVSIAYQIIWTRLLNQKVDGIVLRVTMVKPLLA
jgi:hypothetical protein